MVNEVYRPREEWLESCPAEKDVGVLVDSQLNISWACAEKNNKAGEGTKITKQDIWGVDEGAEVVLSGEKEAGGKPHNTTWKEVVARRVLVFFLIQQLMGHDKTASSYARGGLDAISGRIYSWRGWSDIIMGWPGKWCIAHSGSI